jgi:allantoinase
MFDRLVAGRIVTPSGIIEHGWIGISGGTIAALGSGAFPQAAEVHDHGAAYVLPGAIDGQTHAGSQIGFPGILPTTRAAVRGGVTTIVDMPYDEPEPITTGALLDAKIAAIGENALCHVALYGTVPPHPERTDVEALIAGGVCAFKISSFEAHPTRFPRIDSVATRSLIDMLEGTGLPLGLHNEDQEIVNALRREFEAEGRTAPEDHDPSRPEHAEIAATANFLALGAGSATPLHIVHISTPDGFALVAREREAGRPVSAEMCVHYLHFDAARDMKRLGGRLKVNPPIRSNRVAALWAALETGQVAFVSSDHSAWPLERKDLPSIFAVAAGMPGLDTLLPALFTGAAARHGADAAALLCADQLGARPAAFFGLAGKGSIVPGADADLVVLDPTPYVHDAAADAESVGWSAYDGDEFAARPAATFVGGRLAFEDGQVLAEPGWGRYVPRTPSGTPPRAG